MAAWTQTVNLTEPLGLDGLATGIGTLATAANATLDAAGAALDAAKVFLTGTAAPQAAAAAALVAQAQGLVDDLFGAGFYQLFAHPWQHGVGTGAGIFRALSFPNAITAISRSFDDAGDASRPPFSPLTPVEMIVLVAGTPSPAIFATVLDALNALIDSKELRLARRRLAQAFALEATRTTIRVGSELPDWQSVTTRDVFPALRPLESALKDNLALLKGYAAGAETAVDIAAQLVALKRTQLTTLQANLAAASALFGQGLNEAGAYALHITGAGGSKGLQAELNGATAAPGQELSFCAAVAWVGLDGSLGPVADVLGV